MKQWTLLATMLVTVLGLSISALAQEMTTTDETTPPETTTPAETTTPPETTTPAETTTEEPAPTEPAPSEPAPASEFTLGADGLSVDRTDATGVTNIPCFGAFREEQEELVVTGAYPTAASEAVRACEDFGVANPYPAPYFYDTDGFLYSYDPIEGIYSAPDPATGFVYIYSPANGAFYTYDPATGTYV